MKINSEIRFANKELKIALNKLKNTTLHNHINQALDNIEQNAFCGVQIPKKLIPKQFKEYKNLWKYNLPKGWRLLYSITNNEIIVISIILEWFNHKKYERKFKY